MTTSIEMALEVLAAMPADERTPMAERIASSASGAAHLASSSACPASLLESLASHGSASVRRRVAANPLTPERIRKALRSDKAASVRTAASSKVAAAPSSDPHAYTPGNVARYVAAAAKSFRSGTGPKGVPLAKLTAADPRWASDCDLADALLKALPAGGPQGRHAAWGYGYFVSALTSAFSTELLVGRIAHLAACGELPWDANDALKVVLDKVDCLTVDDLHRLLDPHADLLAKVSARQRSTGVVEALTSSVPKVLFSLAPTHPTHATPESLLAFERAIDVVSIEPLLEFTSDRLVDFAYDLSDFEKMSTGFLFRRLADRLTREGVADDLLEAAEPAAVILAAFGVLAGRQERGLELLLDPLTEWVRAHPGQSVWDGPWEIEALFACMSLPHLPEEFQVKIIQSGLSDLVDELVDCGQPSSRAVVALAHVRPAVPAALLARVEPADALDLPWQTVRSDARLRAVVCERLAVLLAEQASRADTFISLELAFDGTAAELIGAVTHL